ncbi:MAG: outer membrane lipoprotein-sorting protein [Acidobacteriota bacterium]
MRNYIFSVVLVLMSVSFLLTGSVHSAVDARKVVEGVYTQDTSRDASWRATMDVYDKKGTVREKKFLFRRLGPFGNSKTLLRFTEPAEVRGVGLLSFNQKESKERQWLYTPTIQRVRRVAPQERSRRFLGTDFTHEDLAERVIDDFEYRLLLENEVIDGHSTYKIEGKPLSADRSQYKVFYLWIPKDLPYTILAELYNQNGEKVRVYHASNLEKIYGIWVAKRIEMISLPNNTKTVLNIDEVRFNQNLKEDLFTLQALEKETLF